MTLHTPLWMQNGDYPAALDRQLLDILFAAAGGVIGSGDFAVSQRAAGANMSVDIAVGKAVVPGTEVVSQGKYLAWSDAVYNLTLAPAPGTGLSRISLIVLTVRDAGSIGGTNSDFIPQEIAGTAASSPTAPAVPASSILLASVVVGPTVSTIVNANITDARNLATLASDARTSQLFVASGTYQTPNDGVSHTYGFTLVGGGGGGAGGQSGSSVAPGSGGGGGGAGMFRRAVLTIPPNTMLTVTRGAGGAGGAGGIYGGSGFVNGANGGNGTVSSVSGGPETISAAGGLGGSGSGTGGSAAGNIANSTLGAGGAGGTNGTAGSPFPGGGSGGGGGGTGVAGTGGGGAGISGSWSATNPGGGAQAANTGSVLGASATAATDNSGSGGGAGGGGVTASNGGAGAAGAGGQVLIELLA